MAQARRTRTNATSSTFDRIFVFAFFPQHQQHQQQSRISRSLSVPVWQLGERYPGERVISGVVAEEEDLPSSSRRE